MNSQALSNPSALVISYLVLTSLLVLKLDTQLSGRCSGNTSTLQHGELQENPCEKPANKIVAENCKPGNPSEEWDINGAGDPAIQGFATDVSVTLGQTVYFKIETHSPKYRIDIYRMGYYGGMGARKLTTIHPSAPLPQAQPPCLSDPVTRLLDCGNWLTSASWAVPSDATSGFYFARLVREDSELSNWRADNSQVREFYYRGTDMVSPEEPPPPEPHGYGGLGLGRLANALKEPRASHIYFIIRDDEGESEILFQAADVSAQAYNRYGGPYGAGSNTYGSFIQGQRVPGNMLRAYEVSFNRPLTNRDWQPVDEPFHAEYPMVRWLESNGYDVSYFSGLDSARYGGEIKEHKIFIDVGHDEYWSGEQRKNVEMARDSGVHLAFFSGNEMFWKVRYRDSIDGQDTPYRTLVCYKENHSNMKLDPVPDVWTGTWRSSAPYNPEGAQPENAVTGQIFTVNGWRNDAIKVPAAYGRFRFWRNTDIANLKPGETAILKGATLGMEWDEDLDNGFRPAGLMHLSSTTVDNVPYIQDFGSVYDSGTATHHLTLYRAKSGALVFGAGTIQWSWGLDPNHDNEMGLPAPVGSYGIRIGLDQRGPDQRVQQATVNLFADMGTQPTTLRPGLIPAEESSDTVTPVARVLSPNDRSQLPSGSVLISGTASDSGGGTVAAVELSVDGGQNWHPAQGWERWNYEWRIPPKTKTAQIVARATDDSGNLGELSNQVTITIDNLSNP